MSQHATLALVGAVGGAGTTRTTVESGAALARAGYDVTVLDAAFATQGLSEHVEGRIDADLTAVLADDADLEAATFPVATDLPGRLDAVPAHAPFDRLARAKTAGAAERFERQIAAAGLAADAVLVDTPPLAANQAVAAVDACQRVAAVAPDTGRGADGLARTRARLQDVGAGLDAVVATPGPESGGIEEATARLPESPVTAAGDCPTAGQAESAYARAVAQFVEATLGLEVDVEFEESGRFGGLVGSD